MENLEKVELIREKCNVSYEEARDALNACDGDVLDAIVMLEQEHGTTKRMASDIPPAPEAAYELPEAAAGATSATGTAGSGTSRAASVWKRFCTRCKELWNAGMEMTFVAERKDEQVFALPMAVMVLGLLFWGATLWLLVIGLFFGFHYRIEGGSKAAQTVNDAMDKAAEAAESVKQSIA